MKLNYLFFLIVLISLSAPAMGADYVVLNSGETHIFTTSAGVPYSWQVDGVDQGVATQTFTTSWTDGKLHYVVGYYGGAGAYVEWRVSVQRTLATTPVPTLNVTGYNDIKRDVRHYDLQAVFQDGLTPYTYTMGQAFYLLIWAMIFVAYWIRQRSMTFPTVFGLVFGSVIIGLLPEEYQKFSWGLIAVGAFAVFYLAITERRQ